MYSHTGRAVHSANGTGRNQLADLDAEGKVAGPDGLHQEQVLLLGLGDELLGLCGGNGQSLFAEDVLASLESEHGILEVVAVRGGDVDDVDVGVGDELGVGTVGLGGRGTLDLLDEAGSTVGRARGGDGDNLVADIVDVADGRVAEQVSAERCCICQSWRMRGGTL